MAVGSGSQFRIDTREIEWALDEVKAARNALNDLDKNKGVRGYTPAGTRMVRELRKQTRIMTKDIMIPAIRAAASTSFEQEIAKTAVAVNDWIPVVKVGKTQPRGLRGWKYVPQVDRARMKGTLAYGAEYGPKGGHRKGRFKGLGINYYGRPRRESGYFITPAMASARVTRGVIQGYAAVVDAVFEQFTKGGIRLSRRQRG